ncbi:DNRLRE domain-containing protein, partial [Verrucomicrobiota bacterium]
MSKFDVSSIPVGSVVSSAKLHLYVHDQLPILRYNVNVDLHAVTNTWDEYAVTWVDDIGPLLGRKRFSTITNGNWCVYDVPAATVQSWIDAPGDNHGLLLKGEDESKEAMVDNKENVNVLKFVSSENISTGLRPKLEITFAPSGNIKPHVGLTIDSDAVMHPRNDFLLTADAMDTDGSVTSVRFYADGGLVAEDFTAPYSCIWSGVSPGTHDFYARAYDNSGASAVSATETMIAADFIYTENMDFDPQWTFEGSWEYGVPQGKSVSYSLPDPTSGFTGSNVVACNLNGGHGDANPAINATTFAINCSNYRNTRLRCRYWLSVDGAPSAARVQVSGNGSSWQDVWTANDWAALRGGDWRFMDCDISAIADQQSTVYLRWVLYNHYGRPYAGWNVDDVEVLGD